MRTTYADQIGPGKFEAETPLTVYVYEHLDMITIDEDASSEASGYVARIGKRILVEDVNGFATLLNFGTVSKAKEIFDIYTAEMGELDDQGKGY